MSKLSARLAALAVLVSLSLPAAAAVETFLKIPGAPGESVDKDHAREIEVLSWSWGATNLGKDGVVLAPFTWTQNLDSAFVPLFLGLVNDTEFDPVELSVRRVSDRVSADFFEMTLSDAHVLNLSSSGSGDGVIVNGALSYSGIAMSYCPLDSKGGLGACVKGSFKPTKTGAMSFTGDPLVLRGLAEAGGVTNFAISPVPEPSAPLAALAGALVIGGLLGRRARR